MDGRFVLVGTPKHGIASQVKKEERMDSESTSQMES